MDITVFLGAPGSGKGTQAKRLASAGGVKHFSTGDMLRAAIAEGSEVGRRLKLILDKGELVPDDVMIELIQSALAKVPAGMKVILDGFPRTVPQAEALDSTSDTAVTRAIQFVMPEKELVHRLTGRRTCEKCGEPFHVIEMPPKVDGVCDKCGGKLLQRADDSEGVVKKRLEIFNKQNGGLVEYYKTRGRLKNIDAHQPAKAVQSSLVGLLH